VTGSRKTRRPAPDQLGVNTLDINSLVDGGHATGSVSYGSDHRRPQPGAETDFGVSGVYQTALR
jgi:hypothetical protein